MPRNSCVMAPAQDRFVKLSRWHIDICQGDKCAALILSVMISYHDFLLSKRPHNQALNHVAEKHGDDRCQEENLLQFHTYEELSERILYLYNQTTIRKAVKKLVDWGLISIHQNPNPRYRYDRTTHYLFHPKACEAWITKTHSAKAMTSLNKPLDSTALKKEDETKSLSQVSKLTDRGDKFCQIESAKLTDPLNKSEGTIQTTDKQTERITAATTDKNKKSNREASHRSATTFHSLSKTEGWIGERLTEQQQQIVKQRVSQLSREGFTQQPSVLLQAIITTLLNPNSFTQAHQNFFKKLNTIQKQIRSGRWRPPPSFMEKRQRITEQTEPPHKLVYRDLWGDVQHWQSLRQIATENQNTEQQACITKRLQLAQQRLISFLKKHPEFQSTRSMDSTGESSS